MSSPQHRLEEARGILAARLREIRSAAGITGRDLAQQAGWHFSKVSKLENNKQLPSETDVRDWCRICEAESQTTDLVASVRNVNAFYTEWRRLEETGIGQVQRSFLPLYERTSQFRVFQHSAIPGLIQTPAYARGHLKKIVGFRGIPDDVDTAVEARMRQQDVMTTGARRFAFLIGEQALHTPYCASAEMAAQMDQLIDLTRRVNVSIGVVIWRPETGIWPPENFWIYDTEQVRVDTIPGQVRVKAPGDVALYEKAFQALSESAVYGDEARALFAAAQRKWSGQS
ncbi:helix-turn-helix domain-containing protein [Nonomuraea sp. SMC257]|uniref:Helix-turn-helix domain-containing protein n=1 Tax=Nonomuraea montanisoli TaxID=2741721 RepID=A0A7Y6M173_9ACTN|nr:helix-turn-helix transcriptional regulator [Nonomuraea montanisoli]NUW29824.1 helix-turn-helix domain-containing protein [Nonomuraea montanisoli]